MYSHQGSGEGSKIPKVLHIYKSYYPSTTGGVEQSIRQLASGCRSLGWDSSVFTLTSSTSDSPIMFEGSEVFQVRRDFAIASTPFSFKAPFNLKKILPAFDLLHFHYPFPFGDLMHLLANVKKPAIVTYHSDIIRQKALHHVYRPLQDWFLSSMDRIVCTSPNYLATSKNLNLFRNKVEVVPLGIDDALAAKADKDVQSPDVLHTDKFILFVGALRTYKGIKVLLEAAKSTRGTVLLAGGGDLLPSLKVQLRKAKIENVALLGEVTDTEKFKLMSQSRAVILPSNQRSEAFGMVLVEASMMGKAMISTELGTGTSFVNLDGVTGLVVKPDCHTALTDAMNRMLENEDEASSFGMAARKRYETHFTGQQMCKKYVQIYSEVSR